MSSKFIHVHTHSHYSLLDGLSKIPDIVAKAKEYDMPAVALTDHGVMYGAIEFYNECKKQGIKPIIGCELYIAPRRMQDKTPKIDTRPYHLVLLARNYTGYKNLVKLVTEAHLKGYYYKPRVDKETLSRYSEGLLATGACLHGEVSRLVLSGKMDKAKEAIKFYKKIFGDGNFYLEVQYRPELPGQVTANEAMYKLSKETNTPVIATNDSHYLDIEDREVHEVLLSIQTGKDFDDKSRLSMINSDLSFYSPEHAQKIFADHPEALTNTLEIADKCNLELKLGEIILPRFEIPTKQDSFGYMRTLAEEGFKERYPKSTTDYKKRFEYELSVIKKTGYADYFLIVQDFINWAKDNGVIVGPGRGSAAGSMVAYCLKITDLDPLKYDLLFERFLNPERISMPDIDVDFADDGRGGVIKYVQQKYGVDNVSQIITFGTMAARGSIRDAARALGMTYDDGDRIAKLIPFGMGLKESLDDVKDLKQIYNQEKNFKKLIDMALKLEGVARHAGTHACGVVISKEKLTEYLPLQIAAKGETSVTTQYSMKYVEQIGLLKMDFLGLSNLTVIKNCLRIVKKLYGKEINISQVPIDDKKTYELLSEGKTTGVFQLESTGMKRYLKQLKPSVFEDIIAMVALYRPGPMENIPDYIAGKHGKKKITYLHPKLEPVFKNTYGIAVYQEQLMQIARSLAGFSYGEADVLRKAVGKKIMELLQEQKTKLIAGMVKNKIPKATAQKIWQFIEPFAAYGFNKSHAACYAMIAYWTGYLKAHYPSCFMAALLTSDFGNLDRVAIEITECEEMNIKVLPPSVNHSFVEFGVNKVTGDITFGLSAIKGVGYKVSELIVENRSEKGEYKNLEDFVKRLGPEIVNKKTLESLTKAGALDCFGERNEFLSSIETILKYARETHKRSASGQMGLFDTAEKINDSFNKLSLPEVEPATKKERLAWEKEYLGIYLSEHPLDEYKHILKSHTQSIKSIQDRNNKKVRIGGIITSVKKIITKRRKEPMVFATVEDTSSQTEVLVFPKILSENSEIWKEDNIIMLQGTTSVQEGVTKVLVDKVKDIGDQLSLQKYQDKIYIELSAKANKETMLNIKNIITAHVGVKNVIIKLPISGGFKEINTNKKSNLEEIKEEILSLSDVDDIY